MRIGSTRTTVSSPAFATQTPAPFTAIAAGPWPTGMGVVSRVVGSICVTVPSELLAIQTEPSPAAIADGSFPTVTRTTRLEAASIRET